MNDNPESVFDPKRLAALRQTMLMDTAAEPAFDRITQLAAKLLGAPVALISLVDIDRQFFKSNVGLPEPWKTTRQTPLTHSFCKHVVGSKKTLVVNDAKGDPLVRDNLAVGDMNVISYLGAPLTGPGGQTIGALCVIDGVPRQWTGEQEKMLADLAAFVVSEIGSRRANEIERAAEKAVARAVEELQLKEAENRFNAEFRFMADAMPQIVWTARPDGRVDYYNQRWFDYTGLTFEQTKDRGWEPIMHPDDMPGCMEQSVRCAASGEPFERELRLKRGSDGEYRWHLSRSVAMRDADGKIVRRVGTSTDIHDQKTTSAALQGARDQLELRVKERTAELSQQQQFLQAVLDSITDGIIACDSTGRVNLRNRTQRERHNIADQQLIMLDDLPGTFKLHRADGTALLQPEEVPLNRAFRGEVVKDQEILVEVSDGTAMRRMRVNGQALIDTEGNRLGAVVAAHDITDRAEAENKFRILFDQSSDAHLLVGDKGTVDCNPAALKLLGCNDKQQMLSLHPATFSPEFQPDGQRSADKRVVMDDIARRLGNHRFEWVLRRFDGQDVLVEVTLTAIEIGGKKKLLAVLHDLTASRIAENKLRLAYSSLADTHFALRQSEERFAAFMDNSPAVCYIKDEHSRLVYVNRRFETLFNTTSNELVGSAGPCYLAKDVAPQTSANDQLVLQTGMATEFVEVVPLPNGEKRSWMSLKFPLNASDGTRFVGGVSFDITARIDAEAQIERQKQFIEAVLENLTDGVIACDTAGRITFCNSALLKMQGMDRLPETPSSEWANEKLPLYDPAGNKLDWPERPLALALRNISVDGTELMLKPPNGLPRNIVVSARPMADKTGQIIGAVAAWHDVTELRRSQRELLAAKEVADAANQAKSEFLANMSHEIRTPMTAILGYTDLLADATQAPRLRSEYVQIIRRNGQHLLQLLSDILDLSKVEAGELTLEKLAFDPSEMLAEIESLMRPHAAGKNISLAIRLRTPLPQSIVTDPTRLKQILLNLVGNAVKFTERGRVVISAGMDNTAAGDHLRFDVADTGIGMTPEQQANLFHPFRQADNSTTRRFGGTGLGLAICKRLARMVGGTLTVTSEAGRGSTFTLVLPVQSPTACSDAPIAVDTRSAESVHLTGRILVAEDGLDTLRLVRLYLEAAGLVVETADNGRIAIDSITQADRKGQPFDAVLMDMQMPELDGYAATTRLREAGFAKLPIIAFTAHALAGERETCIRCGCSDYVTKPIDRAELLRVLARYLPAATATSTTVLRSEKTHDPLISTILVEYINGLPEHIGKISQFLSQADLRGLRLVVHQLKGSGGSYGFPEITARARSAEAAITGKEPMDRIVNEVQSLVELVRTVDGYDRSRETTPAADTGLAASAASGFVDATSA